MRITALLYHDVVDPDAFGTSGFAGGDADIYKLSQHEFRRHYEAVADVAVPSPPIEQLLRAPDRAHAVLFTFDDGGSGAIRHTAPTLESRGWRGLFFVPTDMIGRDGFMHDADLRELYGRGHVIGSHSRSHPMRMSSLPSHRIAAEWRDSRLRLEDVLGAPVRTGSVPAGFYSRRVAELAFESGLTVLFTSEPTSRVRQVAGGAVVGRFSIMRDDPPALPRAFALERRMPAWRQAAFWNAKKVVKAVGGERWLAFRRRVLAGR